MFITKDKISAILRVEDSKVFYPSKDFYIPKFYFYKHCIEFFSIFLKVYNIRYTEIFNCVRYSDLFKLVCYFKYDKLFMREKKEGLGIASVFYLRDDGVSHVVNLIVYEQDKLIDFKFFEPQSLNIINLSDTEKDNVKYIIF